MSGLRKFAAVGPLFVMQEDGETLYNNKTETYFKANHDTGFYQEVDDNDVFVGDPISPGFIVNVGAQTLSVFGKMMASKSLSLVSLFGQ